MYVDAEQVSSGLILSFGTFLSYALVFLFFFYSEYILNVLYSVYMICDL